MRLVLKQMWRRSMAGVPNLALGIDSGSAQLDELGTASRPRLHLSSHQAG